MANASVFAETNASIFLRLNGANTQTRQIAWQEFHDRYAPAIAGFARKLGSPANDVDDIVQDVLIGFFAKSPTFAYDPTRGRFRGYLKTCICHVLRKRAQRTTNRAAVALDQIDAQALEVEQAWNDVWEHELLCRALEQVRAEIGLTKTFRAFEQYVMLDRPAQDVSRELGLHVDNVYRCKQQITQLLRERIGAIREEE
jgi:RNA polymerase sigma-70 factor (ECF subfamily)